MGVLQLSVTAVNIADIIHRPALLVQDGCDHQLSPFKDWIGVHDHPVTGPAQSCVAFH